MDIIMGKKVTEVDLELVKNYLRIDFNDDDIFLNTLIVSANSFIQSYLKRKYTDFEELPDEFTIACLAIVGHWYGNRSIQAVGTANSAQELKYMFGGLLDPHCVYGEE